MFLDTKECAYSDLRCLVAGSRLAKFNGIEFGVATDKAHIFGEGDMPLGIQSGNRTPSGNLMLKHGALHDMIKAAIGAGGRDVTDLEFDIVIVYQAAKNRPLKTVTLIGCQISEWMEAWAQGDLESKITLPFLYLDIKIA